MARPSPIARGLLVLLLGGCVRLPGPPAASPDGAPADVVRGDRPRLDVPAADGLAAVGDGSPDRGAGSADGPRQEGPNVIEAGGTCLTQQEWSCTSPGGKCDATCGVWTIQCGGQNCHCLTPTGNKQCPNGSGWSFPGSCSMGCLSAAAQKCCFL